MPSELWERIRALRKHLNMSGEEFGGVVGGSKAAVSQWEAEDKAKRTTPDLQKVIAMKREFGVPLDWLLDDQQPANHEWWTDGQAAKMPLSLDTAIAAIAGAVRAASRETRGRLSAALSSLAMAPDSLELQVEIARLLEPARGVGADAEPVATDISPKMAVLSARLDSIADPARRHQAYALLRVALQNVEEFAASADSPSPTAPPPQPGSAAPAHARRK